MGRLFTFRTALLAICFTALTMTGANAQSPAYRPGELIVKFKSTHRAAAAGFQRNHLLRSLGTMSRGRLHHIALPSSMSVEQAVEMFQQDPEVAFAEPNYFLHAQTLPDDPNLDRQWGLVNTGQVVSGYAGTPGADIGAADAWEIAGGEGAEVVVAVIDTGVAYDHTDLSAMIWTNSDEIADNGIDDDGNGWVDDVRGWDFVNDDNTPMDATGHGTHVAGIIAAQRDNGIGITGISDRIRIMPLRFMDAFNRGTIADAIDAIEYAASNGARIINCSWGTTGYSYALREAIASTDALFVCAAGNEGTNSDITGFFPANFPLSNVLSVTASDQMDQLAWFANYGQYSVDVAAPGIRIYSLKHSRQMIWEDDFDDADLGDWQTGGDSPGWSVIDPPYSASSPALATNPDGGYEADIDTWIISPTLDLSQAAATTVTFFLIGSTQLNYDVLYVEVSSNLNTWYARPLKKGSIIVDSGISGAVPYWIPVTADLGPWDGEEQVNIRFRFISNSSSEDSGFFIDNISVSAAAAEGERYQFMHGTSMAAGFASGVAGMVLSNDLALTPLQMKTVIEKSVDLDYGLYGDVATAGRINAYNALTLLSDLSLTADASAGGINLSWSGSTPLSATISIERRSEAEATFQQVAQVSASENNYTDEDLPDNGVFYYRVLAETQDGRSGYSPQALAAPDEQTAASSSSGGGSGGGGCFVNSLILPY